MNIAEIYKKFKECGSVTTDSRTLKGGEMFIALKGENFDGNKFALKALEDGAAYAVVDKESEAAKSDVPGLIRVDDTLKTLQELARWHRSMTFVNGKPLTVIALTGTNGKTTTKELLREVLSVKYRVTATEGNLNNSIGVPLTLLKIDENTQIAVVEMGGSHPGDIAELVNVALPDYGLVTNVGRAHLSGFGSFEGVMNTKGELYDYLRRTSDKVFVNVDDPCLCRMASDRGLYDNPERMEPLVIPYGLDYAGAEVIPSDVTHPFLRLRLEGGRILETNLVGSYNADNVMAALAVGGYFGVPFDDAVKAIEAYVPSNSRSQLSRTDRNVLIIDAYNANPSSMRVALDSLETVVSDSKVALLGEMLELGEVSGELHSEVACRAMEMDLSLLCLVGEGFRPFVESHTYGNTEVMWFGNSAELGMWLNDNPIDNSVVLIKGSRGTRMEKVLPML